MVLNVHKSHQAHLGRGEGVGVGGGGGVFFFVFCFFKSLHCHHQNDSCMKMGIDESHFNVSLIVRDNVTRLSTDHNF